MDNTQLDDLNDLVSELKNTKSLTGIMIPPQAVDTDTQPEPITDINIDDFIYRKSSMLIQQGIDTIERIKGTVLSGADAETIGAYSKLMASTTSAIEILNKINIQKRKEKVAKELKQMDLDASSKLIDRHDGTTKIGHQTNNIIMASREEIIKAMLTQANTNIVQEKPAIDIV